jgi:large subunit ribosomal protein L12
MEYVYSAMILHSAGKEITEDNITKVLKAVGIKPDTSRVKALTATLEGVDIEEAIKTAAVAPATATLEGVDIEEAIKTAAVAPAAAAPAAEEPKKEEKKEEKKEKKEEVSEEEAAAGLGALFG